MKIDRTNIRMKRRAYLIPTNFMVNRPPKTAVHFESYVWFKFVLSLVNQQAHDSKSVLKSTTYYRDVKKFAVTNTVLSTHLGLKLSRKLNEM